MLAVRRDCCMQKKCSRAEPYEVCITSAAHRSQQLEVVDRLEKIRLAVTIVTDQDDTVGRECEVCTREVSEVAN